jgi:hypothetical protein
MMGRLQRRKKDGDLFGLTDFLAEIHQRNSGEPDVVLKTCPKQRHYDGCGRVWESSLRLPLGGISVIVCKCECHLSPEERKKKKQRQKKRV